MEIEPGHHLAGGGIVGNGGEPIADHLAGN